MYVYCNQCIPISGHAAIQNYGPYKCAHQKHQQHVHVTASKYQIINGMFFPPPDLSFYHKTVSKLVNKILTSYLHFFHFSFFLSFHCLF